ncbi:MAG: 2-dehydropantoate 2-reductase [Acetatifactor sp.]|nr:2-dehydropantoate 2-reductase [Acetatifactor sp.]
MTINTVAILGAGAVGGYFIWGLSEKLGERLWVIAEGERRERLLRDGIEINGRKYALNVRTPEEAAGVDLLLVATKYGSLEESLPMIEKIVGEHTVVMSLLNGVDSEEVIGERIGKEHLIYSVMKIASERKGDQVVFDGPSTSGVFFGEVEEGTSTERLEAIAEVFEGTALSFHVVSDILTQIWYKFALNVSRNQPQAIIGCGVGAYEDSEHVAYISEKLREEVVAVAAAKGIDISKPTDGAGSSSPSAKRARYSTLQDLDAERPTEVGMFAGAVMKMGKELGISVPYNEMTYHLIKALEEKNEGKFDY